MTASIWTSSRKSAAKVRRRPKRGERAAQRRKFSPCKNSKRSSWLKEWLSNRSWSHSRYFFWAQHWKSLFFPDYCYLKLIKFTLPEKTFCNLKCKLQIVSLARQGLWTPNVNPVANFDLSDVWANLKFVKSANLPGKFSSLVTALECLFVWLGYFVTLLFFTGSSGTSR